LVACGRLSFDRLRRDAGTGDASNDAKIIDANTNTIDAPH